jgi:hypothetical protein
VHRLNNLEVIPIPAAHSRGPNWARQILQSQYRGEAFTLLLDSHHRFVRGWDTKLLKMYSDLKARGCKKPLITAYLPAYDPRREPHGRGREVLKIYPLRRTDGLLTHLTGHPVTLWKWLKSPIVAEYLSLHFLFADGVFNREILFDPEIYFFGDEVLTGLRAYTWGYDMFHPHRVLGWHLYDRATRVPHWDDHEEWHGSELESFRKMHQVATGLRRLPGYLADTRTIGDYESHLGLRLVED